MVMSSSNKKIIRTYRDTLCDRQGREYPNTLVNVYEPGDVVEDDTRFEDLPLSMSMAEYEEIILMQGNYQEIDHLFGVTDGHEEED